MSPALVAVLAGALMLVGLVGVFIPAMPDLLLIWLAALGYGLLVGWGPRGGWLFAGITLLGLIGILADIWVSSAGARAGGASVWGVLGGLALGLVALIVGGPLAGLAGLLAGIFGVEMLRHGEPRRALQATLGTALGYGASFGVKLLLGLGMIGLWAAWLLTSR